MIDPEVTEPIEPAIAVAVPEANRTVAGAWHTVVLMVAVVGVSALSAKNQLAGEEHVNLLASYATTGALELALLGWVAFGLRLSRTKLKTLLGSISLDFRSVALDVGIAVVFWFASLMVLGTAGVAWAGGEYLFTHRLPAGLNASSPSEESSQQKVMRTLSHLAPSNGEEIGAWALLCILAGFSEEVVFRGYLQRQFVAWSHGRIVVGIVASALCFGAAHAYQGIRGMVLISIFGSLFSVLAVLRGSLRPGMFAHTWHDLFTGLVLAFLKARHMI